MQEQKSEPIAVSVRSLKTYGCPHCRYHYARDLGAWAGTVVHKCGHCCQIYVSLAKDITQCCIGFDPEDFSVVGPYAGKTAIYPKLEKHPNTAGGVWGKPDTRPKYGGEYFSTGRFRPKTCVPEAAASVKCFVCGDNSTPSKLECSVKCRAAGERIVPMFGEERVYFKADQLCYPNSALVIYIGACEKHEVNLAELVALVSRGNRGIISSELLTIDPDVIHWATREMALVDKPHVRELSKT